MKTRRPPFSAIAQERMKMTTITEVYVKHYLPEKSSKRAPSTIAGYESSMRLYVLPRWGEREIEGIGAQELQEWVDSIGMPGAAEKAFKCLRQVIRWWMRRECLQINDPTRSVELPKKVPYTPDVLDSEGVSQMLKAMWGHWAEANAICAVTLGLRRGEACALEWGDINLKTGEVKISKSRQLVNGQIITVQTKTEKSTRSCFLPKFAIQRLRQIKGNKKGLLSGDVSPDKVARAIKTQCKKAGVPCVSMTNMRHTWATMAIEAGVGIETVAMMLGHTEISTAYDHYIVPRKNICQEAQKSVEKLIFQNTK